MLFKQCALNNFNSSDAFLTTFLQQIFCPTKCWGRHFRNFVIKSIPHKAELRADQDGT